MQKCNSANTTDLRAGQVLVLLELELGLFVWFYAYGVWHKI